MPGGAENNSRDAQNSEQNYSEKDFIQTLSIVAALIATVTFAAVFTIPGGVNDDMGTPLRVRSSALKVFIISNSLAQFFSMAAIILCFSVSYTLMSSKYKKSPSEDSKTPSEDSKTLLVDSKTALSFANTFVHWAFAASVVSYSSALYVLVAPTYLWLAVFASIVGCTVPFVGVVWQTVEAYKQWK